MQVSFKANYIDDISLKYSKKGAFAELNPGNLNDLYTLAKVANGWNTKLMSGILYDAMECRNKSDTSVRFYAATRQLDNLEELNPAQVLGVMETQKLSDKQIKINLFQINPLNKKEGIGKTMVEYLKTVFPCHDILAHPLADVEGFYEKLGFKPMGGFINWILKCK